MKLLGRYHFVGPYKLRPLNVYCKTKDLTWAINRFAKTVAGRIAGSQYTCDWVTYTEGNTSCMPGRMWLQRIHTKIPSRLKYKKPFKFTVYFIPNTK